MNCLVDIEKLAGKIMFDYSSYKGADICNIM